MIAQSNYDAPTIFRSDFNQSVNINGVRPR